MDEPDRMLEQTGSALEQALLREGRAYHGSEDLRSKTLAALGLAGTAGLATGGALAWFSAKTWSTKLVLMLSAAVVLVGIPVGYFAFQSTPALAPALRPAAVPVPSAMPAAAQPVPAEPPMPAVNAPSATTLPARASVGTGSASSSLRAELAALDAARSTLASGDSVGALAFLDAYFRTFPRGRLHPEAEVLRMDALAKGGRVDDARKYAQEFLRRHPNSVLAARVQSFAKP
jgi:TolA-binding protein